VTTASGTGARRPEERWKLMAPHDEPLPKPRKPQAHIPEGVELRLRQAISQHLLTYRNKHYDRLREHPEFSPYIGRHLGETGRKRLTRLVAEVHKTAPSTRCKRPPSTGAGAAELDCREPPSSAAALPVVVTPSEAFAGAGAVLVDAAQPQQLVQRRLPELERAIAACINEIGEIIDPRLYDKLLRMQLTAIDAVAKLSDRFQAQFSSARFVTGLMSLIEREFADRPDRLAAIQDQIRALAAACGGLVPE
jgi:hypothetical protein